MISLPLRQDGRGPLACWRMRMPLGIVPKGEACSIPDIGGCGGTFCRIYTPSNCSS